MEENQIEEIVGEEGKQKEEKREFKTGTILDDVIKFLKDRIKKKEVDLYDEILPG